MNRRQIFSIHIVLKCQRSSEAQTFARLQYICTFAIEIKYRMQYCMEEPKRGCRARVLSNGTRSLYALRAALCAAPAGVIILNWQHLLVRMIPKHHQDLFATPAFPAPAQGLSAMLVSPGKGSCRHYRFARALARCHCKHGKQWVPDRLIGLGEGSFRLRILQQNPIFVMNCEK